MLHALLVTAGVVVVVTVVAALIVLGLVKTFERLDGERPPEGSRGRRSAWDRRPRRFGRRRQPAWWPEFERAFADYVRSGARRAS